LQSQTLNDSSLFVPVDACSATVKPLKRNVSHAHPFPARLDTHLSVPKAISGQVAASDRMLPRGIRILCAVCAGSKSPRMGEARRGAILLLRRDRPVKAVHLVSATVSR
jgi:hypothetical protein